MSGQFALGYPSIPQGQLLGERLPKALAQVAFFQDLWVRVRFQDLFPPQGSFTQQNKRSPHGQTAPKKEYFQYRPDHAFACNPEPGKQDWQCSGKGRREQEGPREVVSAAYHKFNELNGGNYHEY